MNYNIEEIKEQFKKVIVYSQGCKEEINVDNLFAQWQENKGSFIHKFGEKLIYEIKEPISFELDDEAKKDNFESFINNFETFRLNDEFVDFICEQDYAAFYENKVSKSFCTRDGNVIPVGMKILRAAKYFIEDETELRAFQDAASMLIQETSVVGTLCFSVHPLDYLSVSENNYNWRSCHALDGEYRTGNINYMADNSTIVCYLKGRDEADLPHFPPDVKWNDKKWRMLLCFSEGEDFVMAGKQYPFFAKSALEIINPILSEIFGFDFSSWDNTYIESYSKFIGGSVAAVGPEGAHSLKDSYLVLNRRLYGRSDIIEDKEKTYQFNDLLHSSTYTNPYYSYKRWTRIKAPMIMVGETVDCLRCGESAICASDSLYCIDCELKYGHSTDEKFGICYRCRSRMIWENAVNVYESEWDQGWVCKDCAEEYYEPCDNCKIWYLKGQLNDRKICPYCIQHGY